VYTQPGAPSAAITCISMLDWWLMGIPNVKRFRPYCPECQENFTLMAVLPKEADVNAYLTDAIARHDHKAYQESKQLHYKVRVGQQKQKRAK
jgi:hypothetical protein